MRLLGLLVLRRLTPHGLALPHGLARRARMQCSRCGLLGRQTPNAPPNLSLPEPTWLHFPCRVQCNGELVADNSDPIIAQLDSDLIRKLMDIYLDYYDTGELFSLLY